MKKVTNLVCALILYAFVFSASAQDNKQQFDTKPKSKIGDNWFVSLGGGLSLLQGEQDGDRSLSERMTYGGEFSVGKWFNSKFGMRLQASMGQLKGFNYTLYHEGKYIFGTDRHMTQYPVGFNTDYADGDKFKGDWSFYKEGYNNGNFKLVGDDEGFWQEFGYQTVTVDAMANLTNLFRSYPKDNQVDFIPYVGVGMAHANSSPTNLAYTGFMGKFGVRVAFNFSSLAVFLEPQLNFMSTDMDGYIGNRNMDLVANLMLGLQYNINRNFANEFTLSPEEINYLNGRINENRRIIEGQQDIIERQQALLDKLSSNPPAQPQSNTTVIEKEVTSNDKLLPGYIYFGLDSYVISSGEQTKINAVVSYLKANPDSRLLLIGYADKKTGKTAYNLNLSRQRVQTVAAELERQGINTRRLLTEWKGDSEQPFVQNDWNRVVVMVERK
ncbi:MAG: OmpA family protein [Candidatus Azobacteroides sp.]|nr:OmpA family protein [Candidatus Azobacteroides sp.]